MYEEPQWHERTPIGSASLIICIIYYVYILNFSTIVCPSLFKSATFSYSTAIRYGVFTHPHSLLAIGAGGLGGDVG